eukprot:snap_masked-scaffold_9-processed-gene-3.19-mRNA-1 protein AED:1.00 eAED:1.00 QI:0/-1/0/0/-1/1/1/0/261
MTEKSSNNVPRVNIGARELRFIEETRRSTGLTSNEEKEINSEENPIENVDQEDQAQDNGSQTQNPVENTPLTSQTNDIPRRNSSEDPVHTRRGDADEMRLISPRDFNSLMDSLVSLRREVERSRNTPSSTEVGGQNHASTARAQILADNIPLTFSSTSDSSESEGDDADPRLLTSLSPRSRRMIRKARLREEPYKEKPILKTLDLAEVTKFTSEFDIYETTVIRQRFALPSADLYLNLSNEVKVELVEEGYDMKVQPKILR